MQSFQTSNPLPQNHYDQESKCKLLSQSLPTEFSIKLHPLRGIAQFARKGQNG